MSSRSASIVILCEDDRHEWFVRRYLYRLGFGPRDIVPRTAPTGGGSGVAYVFREYAVALQEVRRRSSRRRSVLIVVVDADTRSTADRRREMNAVLGQAGVDRWTESDPVVLLIPKRNIETWILALTGVVVSESDDYRHDRRVDSSRIRAAANALFEGLRATAVPGTWTESLRDAAHEWRRFALSFP